MILNKCHKRSMKKWQEWKRSTIEKLADTCQVLMKSKIFFRKLTRFTIKLKTSSMGKLIWKNLIKKSIKNGRWNKQKKKLQNVKHVTYCLKDKKEKDIKDIINCFVSFVILSIRLTILTNAPIAVKN